MIRFRPNRGPVLISLLAISFSLLTPTATAAPEPTPAATTAAIAAPTRAPAPTAAVPTGNGVKAAIPLTERAPIQPSTTESSTPGQSGQPGQRIAAAACDPNDFTSRTGAALVQQIRASTMDCVNSLFSLTGAQATGAFREAQMVSVAYGLRDNAATYPGDNTTATGQLVLYLRAGYYAQWYQPDVVGAYGPALRMAIRTALDTFYAGPRAWNVTQANGQTLAEVVILVDSARENARYLWVVTRLLTAYTSAYDAHPAMVAAVNNTFTILFRGHYLPEFVSAVQADPAVLDTVNRFALANLHLLGTDRSYLTANAGRELGRFLQHQPMQAKVRPLAKGLLDRTAITGPTARLWVGVAEMADAYDKSNCAYYGVCDLVARLKAAVLPINHTCNAALRIRAQAMTAAELSTSCTSMANQDAYFHGLVRDPGPVADDRNTTLEVIVFDSSVDYKVYAGPIFGIDTNNGGMYLEGNPATVGNQPRFIAYEAESLRPAFEVWNLNHEYTHYLDGRYNMHGDFTATIATPTVWWIEGVAEYVSWSYRNLTNTAAIAEAGKRTYALSTLFDTTYNHDSNRIYRWGYLAVRYMMQSHPVEMTTLLGHYRSGNYTAARTLLKTTIGTRFDADWNTWLTACAAGNCGGTAALPECAGSDLRALGKNCQRSNRSAVNSDYDYFYLLLPAGTGELTITTSGGTGDCSLYFHPTTWATSNSHTHRSTTTGNAESITVSGPPGGYVYASLKGATACAGVTVATRY